MRLFFLVYFRVKYKNLQDFRKFKKVRKTLLYQRKTVFRKSSEYRFLWEGCSQRTANAREKAEKKKNLNYANCVSRFSTGWGGQNTILRDALIYIALSAPLQELVNRLFYIKALDGVFPCPIR